MPRFWPILLLLAPALLLPGCKSAGEWRAEADERANAYLRAAQADALGKTEAIAIESPADTLRRRLLLNQGLLHADFASLGVRDLPENRYWKPEERLLPGAEGDAASFATNGPAPLEIGLTDAVRIAAANNRDFREAKESLYVVALDLDLEGKAFRTTFRGRVDALLASSKAQGESRETSHDESGGLGVSRTFGNGAELSSAIALNLAGMLDGDRATAWGVRADLSVSIPLLRGAGLLVNRESLTQAERNLVYAVREFEQTKRAFVTDVAGAYLSLLLAFRTRQNEDDNYRRVILSTQRSRRMADANRMSKANFDQSYQSELSARASWTAACADYESALETFKIRIGLPPDAKIRPREADLEELRREVESFRPDEKDDTTHSVILSSDGSVEIGEPECVDTGVFAAMTERAIRTAFSNRLDFVSARDRIEDAQRKLLVAEDALRAEVTIGGAATVGQAASPDLGRTGRSHAPFSLGRALLDGALTIDLPFERTAERNAYRRALIALEKAVRDYQEREDALKRTIREDLRNLSLTRENLRIQFRAVDLASRRVRNQDLLLAAGRAEMTDVLDAQAALVSAQNKLYAAITSFRRNRLQLQADLGVLEASADGSWRETDSVASGITP